MGRRGRIRSACMILAVALALSGSIQADAAGFLRDNTETGTDSQELAKSKEELADALEDAEQIRHQRKSAQQRLAELESDKADLTAYIKKLDQNVTEVEDQIAGLEKQMESKETEIDVTKQELETAQHRSDEQYEAMKLRIQYMYEAGQTQYLDILFEAKSLADLLTRAEYISEMVEYDRNMLTQYQETCRIVAETKTVLETEYRELEQLKADNEASLADLEELMAAKNKELETYTVRINEASAEVNEYTQALKEQENLMKQIEAEIKRQEEEERKRQEEEHRQQETGNASGGSGSSSTDFMWPIPDSSRITSRFGPREAPVAGVSNFHKGVDVGAPTGTKIYAAQAGTVVISQYNYSAGNYIMINHGNGVYTVYMHCSKLLVSVGDQVAKGDNIGLVGSTGYSTGPHLHFGVRIDGEYKDPLNYVSVP